MKRYYLIALLLAPLLSIAQSNYKVGYAVNFTGDTLRGYINLKEWGRNPTDISFKTTLADKPRQLGLPDINYFEIFDYVSYRRYTVSVSLNRVDISSPASLADTVTETRNVFLKVIQTGKNVTLYAYRDNLKERFYIKDNSVAAPSELVFGIYQSEISGNVINKTTYRSQLGELVAKYKPGSDELMKKVQQADYSESDLINIASEINGGAHAGASKGGQASTAAVRLFAGLSFFSNTIKDGQYYGSPSSASVAPKITTGADLVLNPAVGHLIFRIQLAYSSNNFSFNNISNPIYNINNPQNSVVKVTQHTLSATPQVIFNIYNAEALKVFVDLGYCINFLSYPGNDAPALRGRTSDGNPIAFDSISEYSTVQLKAGVVIAKRLEIYTAYFPGGDISASQKYSIDMSSYEVGLNYYFGKGPH